MSITSKSEILTSFYVSGWLSLPYSSFADLRINGESGSDR